MNRMRTAAAGVCAVVMLAAPAVANAADVPRPTAPRATTPNAVKPPPVYVCRFNWLGLTCFRLR